MRFCFVVFVLFMSPGLTVAQDAATAEGAAGEAPRDREARSLYEAGEVAYDSGHYEDALQHFRRSYELSGRPVLLFNIGACAERLRRDEEALDAYRGYTDAIPDASNRSAVDARIRILEEAIAERGESAEGSADEQGTRVVTWVSAGISVAFAGLATAAWIVAGNRFDELVDECVDGCLQERIDASTVPRWDRLTTASIVVSAAAAVSALTFFFIETDSPSSVNVGLSPGGVSLGGTF